MTLATVSRRGHGAGDLQRDGWPVLCLVPPLDESDEPRGGPSASGRTTQARRRRRPIRLTRRGRIVVGLFLLSLVIAAMALLAPASQAAAPAGPMRSVVNDHTVNDHTVYVEQQLILPLAS